MRWRIQNASEPNFSVLIIWQWLVLASGAPESFSTNLMQKHQLFNPCALESRDRLPTFFCFFSLLPCNSELKCWRIGTLTPPRICIHMQIHSCSVLACYLFNMRHDNKAREMCACLPRVGWVARHVQVDWRDANNRHRPDGRTGIMSAEGDTNVGSRWHGWTWWDKNAHLTNDQQTLQSSKLIRIQLPVTYNKNGNKEARKEKIHLANTSESNDNLHCIIFLLRTLDATVASICGDSSSSCLQQL